MVWLQKCDVSEIEKQVLTAGTVSSRVITPSKGTAAVAPREDSSLGVRGGAAPPRPPAPADADVMTVPPPRPPAPWAYSVSPPPPEAYIYGLPLVSVVPASVYGVPRVGGGLVVRRIHIVNVSSATS